MDIKRGADLEIQGASFNHMRAIYEGPAFQRWRKSKPAKAWVKAYKPYETSRKLATRVMSAFRK